MLTPPPVLERPETETGDPPLRRSTRIALILLATLGLLIATPGLANTAFAQDTDFNGDGRDDIFWYGPGTTPDYIWYGLSGGGFSSIAQSISGSYKPVTGDFNGDGQHDIFWYGVGSQPDYIWYGLAGGGFSSRAQNINGAYVPVSGDFNGDGQDDIFWYGAGSQPDYIWYGLSGGGFHSRPQRINGSYVPVSGDFNGDGRDDIFWYGVGSQPDYIWYGLSGGGFHSRPQNINGAYEPVSGDFNGDGYADIFWYGVGSQPDYIWYGLAGGGFSSRAQNINGAYVPVSGDFNGDGQDDIFWYGAGSQPDYIWYGLSGGGFHSRPQTINGTYEPVKGDFNGDGRSDIFWYGVGAQPDYIWYGLSGGGFSSRFQNINGRYQVLDGKEAAKPALSPASPGDRGAAVEQIQKRLRDLNFFVPRTNGVYDSITAQAVMAFQKYHGLARDGVAGPATIERMTSATPARALEGGNHVEVSIAKQTLTVVRNGKTLVFNTSTGSPGWDTPRGRFIMSRQINGMRHAPLGQLWRPKYFNGGIAMHGSSSIPGYPASHGCTRLHNEAINYIWDANLVPIGTPVWVY